MFVYVTEKLTPFRNSSGLTFVFVYVKQDQNTKLQSNVVALIEENNRLHEEIRSTFVSDMLRLINLDEGQSMTDKEVRLKLYVFDIFISIF